MTTITLVFAVVAGIALLQAVYYFAAANQPMRGLVWIVAGLFAFGIALWQLGSIMP